MKIVAGIVLVFLMSFGQSLVIDCDFHMGDWDLIKNSYFCRKTRLENAETLLMKFGAQTILISSLGGRFLILYSYFSKYFFKLAIVMKITNQSRFNILQHG